MRFISLFELEPKYGVGDTTNIKKLEVKILEDEKVVTQIIKDYDSDNSKFKEEFLQAKINFLKNQVLYDWLILEYYYDTVLFQELEITPNYTKEEMKKKG